MKLKTYIIPDFKFVEIRTESNHCDIPVISNRGAGTGSGEGETDEFDAPIFRDGIWDEE